MKKTLLVRFFILILATLLLSACGNNPNSVTSTLLDITIDENGLASWNPIEGAVGYEYGFVDEDNTMSFLDFTEESSLQLYEGYCLHIRAVFGDEKYGDWTITEMYGDPANRPLHIGKIQENYTTRWENVLEFDLIGSIKRETVKTDADGNVTFEALTPTGKTLRFVGTDLTVTEDTLIFMPQSTLICLDAIGRICAYSAKFTEETPVVNGIFIESAYTFSEEALHIASTEELARISVTGFNQTELKLEETVSVMDFQPNYISLTGYPYSNGATEIAKLTVYYDETSYVTPLRHVEFFVDFYTAYLEGERYEPERETFDLDEGILDFYLIAVPDLPDVIKEKPVEELVINNIASLYGIENGVIRVGDIKTTDGTTVDKETHKLMGGETLEIDIGDYSFDVALPITPVHKDAQNMNDLVPFAYPEATGTLNTLVIPIVWQDEPEDASAEMLARYRGELGRVMDENGNISDYSDTMTDESRLSLSKYFDIASYGKLTVQSFITDWYYAPFNFSDVKDLPPDQDFTNAMMEWLYAAYPDMDWTKFDKDANGYFDAVILINAGNVGEEGYQTISFGGGIMNRSTYTAELAGTPDRPTLNCYTVANANLLDGNVLIHEYGHNLGLVDYYDVNYSGIDAVGMYDMQSGSGGDWNPYSKYTVGWIEPEIVRDLESGESVEITIGAMATTGDAIVIPGAYSPYFDSPFSEYIMIDLFTDKGVNAYDAHMLGLDDTVGVRIYHVNSLMEYRELTVEGDDETYPIGTIHTANIYDYTEKGDYLIELIQAGGDNTFTDLTNLRTMFSAEDLFEAGDVFTTESYSEFFHNGLMADGTEFGYRIEIVEVTTGEEPTATIRVTRE